MTDIVEKLRETGSDLADDAADEIERLRGALDTCRELREYDRTEIERLRKMLDECVREREDYNGKHQAACLEVERLRDKLHSVHGRLHKLKEIK